MKNGKRAAIAAVCLAALVGGYFVFRRRENTGHHPAYGDVATWLTFVAAAIGIPFAVYQFVLQRRQLADQQKAITEEFALQKKRDELLEGQLHQVRAANRVLIRQQAERVDLRFDHWAARIAHNQGQDIHSEARHFARVANRSTRPIRHVSCFIANDVTGASEPAVEVGKYDIRASVRGESMSPEAGNVGRGDPSGRGVRICVRASIQRPAGADYSHLHGRRGREMADRS